VKLDVVKFIAKSILRSALLGTLLLGATAARAAEPRSCSRTQEYITVIEFLRTHDWAIPEQDLRKIARRVALRCPGSAGRFIRVGALLTEAGVSPRNALSLAIRYAEKDDEQSSRFIALFKKLYLENGLDLDLRTSAVMAHELSGELNGSLPGVEREFAQIADFCVAGSGLDQGKPKCARFAASIIQSAKDQSPGVYQRWKRAFDFLGSPNGARLTTASAATLAVEIVSAGDVGTESFIQAYKYALSSRGLKLDRGSALDFSRQLILSELSEKNVTTSKQLAPRRKRRDPEITVSTASRTPAQARPKAKH
jgi:hypothetical protein